MIGSQFTTGETAQTLENTIIPSIEDTIVTKARAAGVDERQAVKIAFCESTLRQFAKNGQALRGVHNPDDVGLFQINETYHLKKSRDLGYDIYGTNGNIDYAIWLLGHEGTRHWKWSKPCWSGQ